MNRIIVQLLAKTGAKRREHWTANVARFFWKPLLIDLVITDIQMPEMEEIETIWAMRRTAGVLLIITLSLRRWR